MITLLFFLSSGLFLGWSLGANDAANIFGTAVGSRMVKFKQAAIIGSVFVIIGAVVQGAGANKTLGQLGSVSTLAAAFTVALSAALTVYWMTRFKLPVSTSQSIVGAIIGWNLYTNNPTDTHTLTKIVTSWIAGPILGAIFAILLYLLVKKVLQKISFHLFYRDFVIRLGLIVIGAFGAYSLGANNIANVMGVFTTSVHFANIDLGFTILSGTQQLFAIGGVAIAVGIITYSRRVMETVGQELMPLNSETALIIVLSQALVLFLFSSQSLSNALQSAGLPTIPLVPVSSSQVVIGSIIGIGLIKGGKQIKYKILGSISIGWVATPLIAGVISFFLLFFVHNVFQQEVVSHNIVHAQSSKETVTADSQSTQRNTLDITHINTGEKVIKEHANKNKVHYLWAVIILLLIIIILTFYYFIMRERKNSERCKLIVAELEEEIAFVNDKMGKTINSYHHEHEKLDKELKYRQNEIVTMAMNITRKYEFAKQLKEDINKIKKGINDADTHQALNQVILKINQNLLLDHDRERLQMHLEEQNNKFLYSLAEAFPNLTENEKRLAVLLRMNLSSKEIASILNISTKSVEMNRYRLRKKLHISPKQNLTDFIRNF